MSIQDALELEAANDIAGAVRSLQTLFQREPSNGLIAQALGRVLIKAGRHDDAAVALRVAGDLLPGGNLVNLVLLARLEEGVGLPQHALERWQVVLELAPGDAEATCGVARNLEKQARFSEALEVLVSGPPEIRQSADGLVVAGRCLEKMGRFDEAIDAWSTLLGLRPHHDEAKRSMAAVQARKESGVVGRELDLSRPDDAAIIATVRQAIEEAISKSGASQPTEDYLQRHSYMRFNRSIGNILPWIGRHIDFKSSEVIEVGCGTGSTLIGLAMNSRHVHGYDIDTVVLEACAARARAFGVDNLTLHLCPSDQLHTEMANRHVDGVDAILLYAVLEHLTPSERLEALKNTWNLLRPNGLLVVVEAPNRFSYFDWHTSQLPFFHQLPLELQRLYFDRSARVAYVDSMKRALAAGGDTGLDEALTRFGQSISYHEFELAIGQLDGLVVDDVGHPLVDRVLTGAERIGASMLRTYIETFDVPVPRGFDRPNISVILKKPPG